MRLCSIASGSSGNCIYVGDEETHILIDAGISKKAIEEGLHTLALDGNDLDGIFITHEHSDHIKGLGVMARKYHIPMYGTKETIDYIKGVSSLGKIEDDLFHELLPDKPLSVKSLVLKPFSISHDAANPVAYRVESGSHAVAVATDMGEYTDYTVENLKDLDAVLLEANHDVRMLQTGNYPYQLKQRILGKYGHLCNEISGRLLDTILTGRMKRVFLGHLSKENNYPELAYESVRMEINMSDTPHRADDFEMSVAKRNGISECFEI
jgi:phosphoribosyl 1,2-cyclic phosphodiesterase